MENQKKKMSRKAKLFAIAIITIVMITIPSVIAVTLLTTIPTSGTFTSAYGVTLVPTSVDWGNVTMGVPVTRTVSITNTGTKHITSLAMSTASWTGIGLTDFTLTWDLGGQALNVGVTKTATFVFTLTAPVSSVWSFDIKVSDA